MVTVDNSLKIRRFTPVAQDVLGLVPSDIGRSITNIRLNIPVKSLDKCISEVITKLNVIKTNIEGPEGHWYELRIRPYVTEEKKIDGAVISFIDIDEIIKAKDKILVEAEKYRTLADNAPEIISRFNTDFAFIYVSPSVRTPLAPTLK